MSQAAAVTDPAAIPGPTVVNFPLASSDRFPGLPGAVSQWARALAVLAARKVDVAALAVAQGHRSALSTSDTYWFGTSSGVIVGVRRAGAHAIAEMLLGLEPAAAARPLSAVEEDLVGRGLIPLMEGVVAQVCDPVTPAPGSEGARGSDALTSLSATGVLTIVNLTVTVRCATAPNTPAGTVDCEVVLAAPTSAQARRVLVDLEDLDPLLGNIPIPVRVSLPPTQMRASVLASLAPGSELMLSATQETPWLVEAGSVVVAAGSIGTARNRRSVRIDMTWRQNPMSESVLAGLTAAEAAVESSATEENNPEGLGLLGQVTVEVSAELGRKTLPFRDVAALHPGKVIELDKEPNSPFTILVNNMPYATAEVVVVDGRMGLRVIDLVKR